jgi:glycosyltransferase involved in cell wall biosynthesis
MSAGLSVTLITLNEAENLARALRSVEFANEVIVVDSGSTDETVEIARELGATVFENAWPGYGQQKNFAHQKAQNEWVLSLDADEEVSPALADEIRTVLSTNPRENGFSIPRRTFHLGRWINHGGWYPNRLIRLSRREHSRWTEPQIHEALEVTGATGRLQSDIHHYSFKNLRQQIEVNLRYSHLGYQQLSERGRKRSLLRLIFKPISKFIETFILKRGFLDGVPGLIIAVGAAYSVFLKYSYFYDPTEAKP